MAGLQLLRRLPGRYLAAAACVAIGRTLSEEWRGSDPHRWLTARPRPDGFAQQPEDRRPADPVAGRLILAGTFTLADATMTVGVGGNPWDRACPTRAFAEAMHSFAWLPDLVAVGPDGATEALRLGWSGTACSGAGTPLPGTPQSWRDGCSTWPALGPA